MVSEVIINKRFCGPPNSGNGGYSVALLARELGFNAEVTLKIPPPLDKPMQIIKHDGGVKMMHGDILVGEATPCALEFDIPPAPSFAEALEGEKNFRCYHEHSFPTCFICGPERAQDDGLRLFTGTYDGAPHEDMVAAPWHPSNAFADSDDDGKVDPLFIISALDCPGFFALPYRGRALLGRMQVRLIDGLNVGENAVVAAWHTGHEGRKYYAASVVYNAAGKAIAIGSATWITID